MLIRPNAREKGDSSLTGNPLVPELEFMVGNGIAGNSV